MASKLFQETQNNSLMNNLQQYIQRYNVPKDIQGNPQAIVNYLLQNGMVNQDAVNNAILRAQQMGVKL